MSTPLFDMFDPISAKQWKQKIQVDLKGADYNETLIYKSHEGIDIKPFYNSEDTQHIDQQIDMPSSWNIAQQIVIEDVDQANTLALQAVKEGAESLFFHIPNETIDFKAVLVGIPTTISLYISMDFISISLADILNQVANNGYTIYALNDIIGHLAQEGNWFDSLTKDHQNLEQILQNSTLKSSLSIDLELYQNGGATIIQQLAYSLSHANEYLNHLENKDITILRNTPIIFNVAVGGNYFFEIAKLRALRLLWATLAKEYAVSEECHLIVSPSHRNKTILDYNVNMLRSTTECMSAILGGANTVYNLPYDTIYSNPNDFGNRIAINQLHVLKSESYFGMVDNPADGVYYIESLTAQFAEKALVLFKNIEAGGGFLHQLKEGTIQRKLKESTDREQELFDTNKISLTGTNTYQNKEEQLPSLEKSPFMEIRSRKTLISPILKRRLSEKIEKEFIKNS
ncbi:methylmalonyl-CoA mutase subunit beta [Aquimarina rhabdastrellae]